MGTNILFWKFQGIRPKRKELELYLKENIIDVIALNKTFLSKKHNFRIPGYDLELSNNQNLTLATIYYPNGNPNLKLFQTINNLSDKVMFVGDFNSKLESFGCAKKNASGPMLKIFKNNLTFFT